MQMPATDTEPPPRSTPPASTEGPADPGGPRPRPRGPIGRLLGMDELGVVLALVGLVLLIGIFHSGFLQTQTLLDNANQAALVAISAYGMVFLLAMGDIDLSIAGTYAVSILLPAIWMSNGLNPWIAALLGVALGVALGAVNGILAAIIRVPVIIITLGTLSVYQGIGEVATNGSGVSNLPVTSSFFSILGGTVLGVPFAVVAAVVTCAIMTVGLRTTRFGSMVRAVGSNPQAARFSGIPVARIRMLTLMLLGGLTGLAGVLSLGYFQAADPTVGGGYELQVIAAAVIGGTAVTGGNGTVPGALIGALIVSTIESGLVFFSVPDTWTSIVTGAVIVIAVGVDAAVRWHRRRRLAPT